MKQAELTPLEAALCALAFYRQRHVHQRKFKRSESQETVSVYRQYVRSARDFAKMARGLGFKGSIRSAVAAQNGGAVPTFDDSPFTKCPDCNGTGKRDSENSEKNPAKEP